MSNDNVFERLWKLAASANKLVLDGKREPEAFAEVLQQFVFGNVPDINWQITYAALGMSAEYAEVSKKLGVAENPNLWLVPAVKGVTCNKVVATLREVLKPFGLKVGTDIDDLDKDVSTNDRDPNRDGSYVVGFRRTVEADEENANKSANVLKTESHKGATLLERLLPELGYFLTTRHFLDVKMPPCVRARAAPVATCRACTSSSTVARSLSTGTAPAMLVTTCVPVPLFPPLSRLRKQALMPR